MEIDHLPNRRPPKPIRAPFLSPEFNVQLNVTPEKKGPHESFLSREHARCCSDVVAKDK